MSGKNKDKKFQILSFDGGGIKGILSIAFLSMLQKELNIDNITKHFDLIAGTSTGGIIALALGAGLKVDEILEFYIKDGRDIFKPSLFKDIKRIFWAPKYSNGILENKLKNIFKQKKIIDSKKRLIIPYYNVNENKPSVFKTPHAEGIFKDKNIYMYQVALGTSSAPTYFPLYSFDNKMFIDGGIVANNPTMIAIIEAKTKLGYNIEDICVLSIGTTVEKKTYDCLNKSSAIKWILNGDITDLFIEAQGKTIDEQCDLLLNKNRYLRINVEVPRNFAGIDKYKSKDKLVARADYLVQKYSKNIEEMFFSHKVSDVNFYK
jgi:patatin-like phospholipase/acyl hydrolase